MRPASPWGPWAGYPPVMTFLLIVHHSIGLCGGSMAHLYFIHDSDLQFLVFLLLFAFVVQVLNYPLHPFGDMRDSESPFFLLNFIVVLVGYITALYTRFVLYIPIVYRLERRVFETIGPVTGVLLFFPCGAFVVFSLMMALMSGAGLLEVTHPPKRNRS